MKKLTDALRKCCANLSEPKRQLCLDRQRVRRNNRTSEQKQAFGSTSLCTAMRVTRRDSVVFGFTDHVEAITVDGTLCEPTSAYTGSAVENRVGLSVANLKVSAVLDSAAITKSDLLGGAWDDAEFELFLVNYEDPTQHASLRHGWLGQASVDEVLSTAGELVFKIDALYVT